MKHVVQCLRPAWSHHPGSSPDSTLQWLRGLNTFQLSFPSLPTGLWPEWMGSAERPAHGQSRRSHPPAESGGPLAKVLELRWGTFAGCGGGKGSRYLPSCLLLIPISPSW